MAMLADGRLGLLVGVTGHRHIQASALGAVTASTRRLLRALRDDVDPGTPICILSSLAAGADQIVAAAALEMGMGVIAVLPRSSPGLETEDLQATRALDAILGHPMTDRLDLSAFPELVTCLRAAARTGTHGTYEELQYELAGMVVARHAHLLLALVESFDLRAASGGHPEPGAPIGGVRRIMEFWLDGRLDGVVVGVGPLIGQDPILSPFPTGPLIQIATPRECAAAGLEEAGALVVALPRSKLVRTFAESLGDLIGPTPALGALLAATDPSSAGRSSAPDRAAGDSVAMKFKAFNRMSHPPRDRLSRTFAKSRHDLLSEQDMGSLPIDPRDDERQRAQFILRSRELFARFDGLANLLRQHVVIALICMSLAVLLSVALFEWYLKDQHNDVPLIGYVVIFAASAFLYYVAGLSTRQDWYQDCRFLGEAARVQFFWSLAGMPRSVAAEHRPNQLGEGSWLHAAVKWIAIQGLLLAQYCDARSFVARHWLGADTDTHDAMTQSFSYVAWYHKASLKYGMWNHRLEAARNALVTCSYVIAAITAALVKFRSDFSRQTHPVIVLVISGTLALGGVLEIWRERRAYEHHAREYERMSALVSEALRLLGSSTDPAKQDRYLHAVGEAALTEASQWLLAHRSQPIRPIPPS
jgi:hypothetical protein